MNESHPSRSRHAALGLFALFALVVVGTLAAPAYAQRRGPNKELSRASEGVRSAFRPVMADAGRSTVIVLSEGKEVALGTVVGKDGWIVTKASELTAGTAVTCQLRRDSERLAAKVVGVSDQHDVALLKVEAKNLKPIAWADPAGGVQVGQWVATSFASDTPVAVGVVSVGRRKIPGRSGLLGVMLADAEDRGGAKVAQVVPESPAERAGIRVDDVITKVNEDAIDSREGLVNTVRRYLPGQQVVLAVRRGDKQMEVKATLAGSIGSGGSRAEVMNRMGGALSNRNSNFPTVLQHDTVLQPNQVGGPLVTLDGKAVGINIARAGRVESYALPADVVQSLVEELKSGKHAPTSGTTTRPTTAKSAPADDDEDD